MQPIEVLRVHSYERAAAKAQKKILEGYKPIVMLDKKRKEWIVEVYL